MKGSGSPSPAQDADGNSNNYSVSSQGEGDGEGKATGATSASPGVGPLPSERATANQRPHTHPRPTFDPSLLHFHGFLALCAVARPTHGPPLTLQAMLRHLQPVLEPFIPSDYWPAFEALFLSSIPSQSAQTYIEIMSAVQGMVERLEEQEQQPRHMDQNEPNWWTTDHENS